MIMDTGLTAYEDAVGLQKEFVRKRRLGEIRDSLLIAEHKNVFTIGRSSVRNNLLIGEDALNRSGISVVRSDRGGDITFHGPGQIIIYPIIDLKKRAMDLHRYLRDLEDVAIGFLNSFFIPSGRWEGRTGVWTSGKKIAFIGIAASNWITYHGLSINVNCDLGSFSMMNPCGMTDIEVTSMKQVLGNDISIERAKAGIISNFERIFGPIAE